METVGSSETMSPLIAVDLDLNFWSKILNTKKKPLIANSECHYYLKILKNTATNIFMQDVLYFICKLVSGTVSGWHKLNIK
jgi:hypothetical protein